MNTGGRRPPSERNPEKPDPGSKATSRATIAAEGYAAPPRLRCTRAEMGVFGERRLSLTPSPRTVGAVAGGLGEMPQRLGGGPSSSRGARPQTVSSKRFATGVSSPGAGGDTLARRAASAWSAASTAALHPILESLFCR